MSKAVFIDGHSIIHRAFYGIPILTNARGIHTNAVLGFLNILLKVISTEEPDYLAVAFDEHAPTFRHEKYDVYKGTRKPMPEELREQIPLLKQVLDAMGILRISLAGYEADDILGTCAAIARKQDFDVTIVSGDRDLLQLAEQRVKISIPKTKGGKTITEEYFADDVLKTYQVTPRQFIDVKGLMGDASDNIPGIPGVGEKTATKLIVQYDTIENAYEHLEEIKPNKAKESLRDHYDLAILSKELATIRIDAPINFSLPSAKVENIFTEEAYRLFCDLEFKSLLPRFSMDLQEEKLKETIRVIGNAAEAQEILTNAVKEERIGFSVLAEQGICYAAAISFADGNTWCFRPDDDSFGDMLINLMQNNFSFIKEIAMADVKGLYRFAGSELAGRFFDVEIAAYLINPLKSNTAYEDIAREYSNANYPSRAELLGKLSLQKAADEKPDELRKLAAYMSMTAVKTAPKLAAVIQEKEMENLFWQIEMPLTRVLADMEDCGVTVKKEELQAYGEALVGRITELEKAIWKQAGEEFNINSPKQLGSILFEKLALPGGKKTKTGYSTAADVLDKLASDHKIVADILEYRTLAKLKSTYADGLSGCITEDGKIHTSFQQTITATGRISSTEPNLQNIPIRMELGRRIRKVFVPKEGCVFLDADYSQIELRVLAHCSEDENLIRAYHDARDIHRITASQVFHVPFEDVTDLQRRNAKAVNFGIVYGISSFGLSQDLSISRKEAESYINNYFKTYPGVKQFLDSLVTDAKNSGYAKTLFGRKRPMPELTSSNYMQRSFGERVAMNAPIQGTAADIIKIAMIRVYDRLKAEGLKSKLILQVHDELLIEAYEDEVEKVAVLLKEEMMGAAKLRVPLEVDMHQGNNWYEAK